MRTLLVHNQSFQHPSLIRRRPTGRHSPRLRASSAFSDVFTSPLPPGNRTATPAHVTDRSNPHPRVNVSSPLTVNVFHPDVGRSVTAW